MIDINYYCDPSKIEKNAADQLIKYSDMPHLEKLCAFTDIHFCDEKAIPVGVAFSTKDHFYPLVTGKDVGCGVMYLMVPKISLLKPFDKATHFKAFEREHKIMTDDGLGGGNHFLSIEEDEKHIFIICHTGSRNRGIALYQHNYELVNNYKRESGQDVDYVTTDFVDDEYWKMYYGVLQHAHERRKSFVFKTLIWLQMANYINHRTNRQELMRQFRQPNFNDMPLTGEVNGVWYEMNDSDHNHLQWLGNRVIHRKGSTYLIPDTISVIPLSMSRGCLLVKSYHTQELSNALYSCSHGAGRKLSRFDAMKHWRTTLKEKERKQYKEQFSELLDRSGEFPSGYIQEFDYAYKDSSEILKMQPYLRKVTQTTPIVTVKYTEI